MSLAQQYIICARSKDMWDEVPPLAEFDKEFFQLGAISRQKEIDYVWFSDGSKMTLMIEPNLVVLCDGVISAVLYR